MLAFFLSLIDNEPEKRRFEEVYMTYRKQMFVLADSILKNKYDAEDVVHDVFYNIATSHMNVLAETENDRDVRNYLLKSVKNESISLIRKRKVRADYLENNKEIIVDLSDNQFLDYVCLHLECSDVIKAMDSLNDRYRDVLYYHFVLDLTIPETAELLGKSINTVQKQLVRGKSLLLNITDFKGEQQNVND